MITLTLNKLLKIAELMGIYISQDEDGFVAFWKEKPRMNGKGGYWERGDNDSILLEPVAPYATNWKKSLITPKTRESKRQASTKMKAIGPNNVRFKPYI